MLISQPKMLNRFGEVASTLKEKLHDHFSVKSDEEKVKEAFKERNLASYFFVASCFVLLLKVSGRFAGDGEWNQFFTVTKDRSTAAFFAAWLFLSSLEWIATPILSGIAMGVITWYTVYLDSYIPGVFPPSPLSPQKSRLHARTFHMGYYLSVINGIIVSAVLLHTNLTQPS